MGSLQKTAACLLFLSVFSSVSHGQLATFICSDVKTEYNKTATISCISNKKITHVVVKRCENCNKQNSCLESVINTWARKDSSEEGRIRLVLQHNVSEVHIQEVKATDEGGYKWHLYSDAGERDGCATLEITDPEIPKTMKEHVATILVLLFLVLCSFAAILYYKYRQRAMARGNFADILRNLLPVLRQYESAEENVSNQEV
ncbi:uncharacterized protein LOC125620977 isoform X2 [Caretta caretta]|uniref:uncharacterized protein LOC125620977 isoform X2 n=1 Tax=Caretta caretta TaxID=8467 RepID=UPI003F4C6CAF